jgi:large subunit ribosomal protein L15
MQIHTVPKRTKRVMPGKRVGRGYGSGKGGHTSTRGMKGQKSRTGHKSMVFFEGGNTPFHRRMPKYPGFKNINRKEYQPVNVSVLEENFEDGAEVTIESLREKALIRKNATLVKILGHGELKKKLTIVGLATSESAKDKIKAAKGKVA